MQTRLIQAALLFFLIGCGSSGSTDTEVVPSPSDAGTETAADAPDSGASEDEPTPESFETGSGEVETGTMPESGPDAEPQGPPPQDVVDFLTKWYETQCSAMTGCCTAAGLGFDTSACVEASRSFVLPLISQDARLNEDRVDRCLDSVQAFYSRCDPEASYNFDWHAEEEIFHLCTGVIEGKALPGENCGGSILGCSATPEGMTTCLDGLCQWILPAKEGEPCSFMSDKSITAECPMPAGLYCSPNHTCSPIGNPGEPCSSSVYPSCFEGWCDSATETCPFVAGPGEVCGSGGPNCAWNLRCDPSTNVCEPAGKAGDACAEDGDCLTMTCVAGRCSPRHHHFYPSIYAECSPP